MDTILLINDSSTLTKVLTNHFQQAGYRVVATPRAVEAYEAFIRQEIHLILTDVVLADRSGVDVIRTFRTKRSLGALPIVVFTASDDEETTKTCVAAGADLVLSKANGTTHLLEKIEELIAEYKANLPERSIDGDMGHCITKATTSVFHTMTSLRIQAGEAQVEKVRMRRAEVIGSIGVAGFLSGSISLFMPRELAQKASAAMLMLDDENELSDEELVDAIGELTNMVGGNIKTELFKKVPLFDISVPSVYVGEDLQRRPVSDDLCFVVPFRVGPWEFAVEFLMVTKEEGGTGVQRALVTGASS